MIRNLLCLAGTLLILNEFCFTVFADPIDSTYLQSPPNGSSFCCNGLSKILPHAVNLPGSFEYQNEQSGLPNSGYWSLQESTLYPACRVTPNNAIEVGKAVKYLASQDCKFAIRSGGHTSWAGAANIGHEGVTIDLSALNSTTISKDRSTACVGSGSRWKDVYSVLNSQGLGVSGGRVATVGVGGLTLGGGKSFFQSKVGFVCDSVVNFELITANGDILQVNNKSHPQVYKALKGGNNNLGIVTHFDFKTFPQGDLWAGLVVYPASTATKQLKALYEFTEAAGSKYDPPGDAQVIFAYITTPEGKFYANFYSYTLPEPYPSQFDEFLSIQPNVSSSLRLANLTDFAMELNNGTPNGQQYIFGTMTFKNNLDFLHELQDFSDRNFAPLVKQNVSGLEISFVLQPLTKPMLAPGCNDNSLGLCPNDGNLMILDLTISWTDAKDNDAVDKAAHSLISGATSKAKKRGLLNEYIYLNYALQSQDPLASYGSDNLKAIEAASHEVDPSRVFQRLVPGGFKLPS